LSNEFLPLYFLGSNACDLAVWCIVNDSLSQTIRVQGTVGDTPENVFVCLFLQRFPLNLNLYRKYIDLKQNKP